MPPAIIAGVGAAAGIGGALIGASSSNKAAKSAAKTQAQSTQAQLTLGRETNAINKDIYNKNFALLDPFVQRGNTAGGAINDLLGIGGAPQAAAPGLQGGTQGGAPGGAPPVADRDTRRRAAGKAAMYSALRRLGVNAEMGVGDGPQSLPTQVEVPVPAPTSQPFTPSPGVSAPGAANNAFQNFANSAGMQFQLAQGRDMIENSAASRGALQSGAAQKSLQDYGQQTALSNYFMPYMSLLGGQQAVGAQAGSAVAGVGSNYGNTIAANNANMGGVMQTGANAQSNAALLRGQNNAQMWNSIGSSLGGLASSFGK